MSIAEWKLCLYAGAFGLVCGWAWGWWGIVVTVIGVLLVNLLGYLLGK